MRKKKIIRWLFITLAVILGVLVILSITGTVAYAAGLVDNTVSDANAYSKYPLENYQLDFYVDSSWGYRGTGWTVSGKAFSMACTLSQTLSGR